MTDERGWMESDNGKWQRMEYYYQYYQWLRMRGDRGWKTTTNDTTTTTELYTKTDTTTTKCIDG